MPGRGADPRRADRDARLVRADGRTRDRARPAAAAGSIMVVSMASSVPLDEIAPAAAGRALVAQMYMLRDRGQTQRSAERGGGAVASAIVASVDGAAVPYGAGGRCRIAATELARPR